MKSCPSENELSKFYDCQLPPGERAIVAAHLTGCGECSQLLKRWSAISHLFIAVSHQQLSAFARARLTRRIGEVADRGLLRLAWTLSGLAASVLLVGMVWLTRAGNVPVPVASPPPWVSVAYASDVAQGQHEPATPAAEYYLASTSSDELP